MAVGLDNSEGAEATMNPMSMFQRFVASDFGVPNGDGVTETPVNVLRDSNPIASEPPGKVARYSTLTTKVLTDCGKFLGGNIYRVMKQVWI